MSFRASGLKSIACKSSEPYSSYKRKKPGKPLPSAVQAQAVTMETSDPSLKAHGPMAQTINDDAFKYWLGLEGHSDRAILAF